ncbi:alpha-glutamyl/putrescinyl thymine pyrophosphorylase clade 3 protein [Pedobacter cryotolerans]|uniref:Alpha-glutamyl/putrescinyl thymine pyrophosphorylase clade 3 domain-containing protein n=1 Tax=Pedobacter cryotolerans TaxID=2571270 RepID=A0A4U1BYW2_9SPHI|nr:hypothetical protein [Pedobacter cryotolerans]TKB96664.1 hypothetical protein FA045_17605 [Pedobacter cryotolerans]
MVADQDSSVSAPYIESRLTQFHHLSHPLLGLSGRGDLQRFVSLLADSAKGTLGIKEFIDNPVLAQILNYQQQSATDEACWLLFLYCYVGRSGLFYAIHRAWSWQKASANADDFHDWLTGNQQELKNVGSLSMVHKYRGFDQHRAEAMAEGVKSYIAWVKAAGDHAGLFQNAIADCQGQSMIAFDRIYLSMNEHTSFKRQIKLDYLCMIGHLKIAGIEPGQFYFSDVLPLKKAARQLFSGHPSVKMPPSELNELMAALRDCLGSPFSIAVLYRTLMDWGNEKRVPINPNFRRY